MRFFKTKSYRFFSSETEEIPLEDFQHSRNSSPHSSCTKIADQLIETNRVIGNIPYNNIFDRSPMNANNFANDRSIMPNVLDSMQQTINNETEITQSKASKETSFIGIENREENASTSSKRNSQIETV